MYMLDTNICIFIIKKRPISVLEKLEKVRGEQICISVVTYAELGYGVERSSSKKLNQEVLDEFISHLLVLPWETEAARQYGKIRTYLENIGTPIGNMDLLIAAHALSGKQILVTNNLREFKRVPHLKCEDWS
jgi:tRNA(fMet)-specific endonuclease VapC